MLHRGASAFAPDAGHAHFHLALPFFNQHHLSLHLYFNTHLHSYSPSPHPSLPFYIFPGSGPWLLGAVLTGLSWCCRGCWQRYVFSRAISHLPNMGDRRATRAPTSHFRLRARSRRCPITPPYTNHPPLPHIPLYRSFLNLVISAALRADLTYSHIVRVRSHVFISTMLLRYLAQVG